MSIQEKLQQAIQATMEAGYQLNSEAFEFLIQNSQTNDPVNLMNLALERIQGLQDKPMFIEKSFLETLLQTIEPAPQIEISKPIYSQSPSIPQPQLRPLEEYQTLTEPEFYPYAREIPSELNILEDATGKLTSNGTLDEYVLYFQDRFKRIEKLLRQRMDVKAATSIIENHLYADREKGLKK
jgi:DNA polymerase II small subunit/DNA polymerase delta subunit B